MFSITHLSGAMAKGDVSDFEGLLDELAEADDEHPDVAVQHESGWGLSIFRGWRLIFKNVETGEGPWWAETAERAEVVRAMTEVSAGTKPAGFAWRPGNGVERPGIVE